MINFNIYSIFILLLIIIINFIVYYVCNINFKNENFTNENLNNKNNLSNTIFEIEKPTTPKQIGFSNIKSNKLYYCEPCKYVKNDALYTVLEKLNYKKTDNIDDACLILPCSYDFINNELNSINNKISTNIYKNDVRIFILNNSDLIVSKILLWMVLENTYGTKIASTMTPMSYGLNHSYSVEKFKKIFDPNKIYIMKNNNQRQEGLKISTDLDEIINSKDKYLLVQELLQNPYCINGHKINLRVYCLVIKDNYGNYNLQIYNNGIVYYTPCKFKKNSKIFDRNITTGYNDGTIWDNNPFTHTEFKNYLNDKNRTKSDIENYIFIYGLNTNFNKTYI